MANRLAKVVITLDGSRVEYGLDKIRQKTAQLTSEMHKLADEGKQNTKKFKETVKAIDKLHKAETDIADVTKRINQYMKNLGNVATTDLRRAYREGIQLREGFKGTDKELKQLNRDLAAMKAQIDKNTAGTQSFGKTHSSVWKSAVRNITAYVGVFGAFNMLRSKLTEVIKLNREFSDQLANIRKVSNLPMEAINELATNLAKIDTRSSIQELNQLAYAGAKLGFGNYGIEGLEAFAKSAVKVQNALKEDMGEDAMTALSKMVEVMGLIPKMGVERAMDATGSAIFKLASTSTATGTNIVEFSKRLMGLANIAHISTEDLLAFGSAADSMALMPEVAATAFNKLITAVQKQPNLIEKALSIPEGTISDLYQAGHMTEAIVTIFERMREKGGMNALMHSGVFKDLGSDGARLVAVMATMSNRVDILHQHLAISRAAFEEGTAVAQEYAIQMETAEAYMERASNLWVKAFVNPEGVDLTKEFAKAWYDVSKSLTQTKSSAFGISLIMKSIFGILTLIVKMLPSLITGFAAWGVTASMTAFANWVKTTGGLMTALGNAMKSLSFAGWTGVITGAAMALWAFYEYLQETNNALRDSRKYMNGFKSDLSEVTAEQHKATRELDAYRRAIDEATMSSKQRQAAITNFNNKFGKYLSNLLTEKSTAQDVAKAYAQVVKQLRAKIALQAKEKDIEQQISTRVGWEANKLESYNKTVKGTNLEQYNSTWLKGFVDDAWAAGKSIRKIADELGGMFGLNANQINYVYKNRGRTYFRAESTAFQASKQGNQMRTSAGLGYRYDPVEAKSGLVNANNTPLLYALNYALQAYSTNNAKIAIDKKYEPFQKDMDELVISEDGTLDALDDAPDKEADKAARAAAAAARKEQAKAKAAMIKQMEQAKKDSTALIDNIEAYYNLQTAALDQSVVDGQRTADEAKALKTELEKKRDTMLYQARLAITGQKNTFDDLRKNQMGADVDMFDFSELSQKILGEILAVNLDEAYKKLAKFDGTDAVYGLNATAFINEIKNKGTEYEKKRAEIEAKQVEAINNILESYDLIEKLYGDTAEDFIKLGFNIANLNDAASASRMQAQKKGLYNPNDTNGEGVDKDEKPVAREIDLGGEGEDKVNPEIEGKAQVRVNAFRQMLDQFIESGIKPYIVDIKDDAELARWFMDFISNGIYNEYGYGELTQWADQNPQIKELYTKLVSMTNNNFQDGKFDAEELKTTLDPIRSEIQTFWSALIGYEDNYFDTQKKIYDNAKKRFEERWERSGEGQAFSDADKELDLMQRRKELSGAEKGTNFAQQAGFTTLSTDPEIAASMLRMEQARRELELVKQVSEDKRLIREKEQELTEAQMKLEEEVMSKINERITKLQEWTAPIEQFGESVGEAMGTALRDGESMSEGIKNALRSMVEAYGKSTIKIVTELMMQRLRKKMLYRAMNADAKKEQKEETNIEQEGGESRLEARSVVETGIAAITQKASNEILTTKKKSDQAEMQQEGAKAKGKVTAGIAEGAADTIGKLGWWGIPLIAVITALLNGLLSMALNALFGSSNSSESTTNNSTKTNTKLVSSMLTYVSGNVQSVLGTDGRFYRATSVPTLPDGVSIVSQPIATTVNGQQALVGEQGPEIVIGRRTSRNIMMNEPALLHHLLQLDRNRTVAGTRQVLDSGNLTTVASADAPTGNSPLLDSDTLAALRALPVVMAALNEQLKKPVHINMYGRDGIYEKSRQAERFMKQYE